MLTTQEAVERVSLKLAELFLKATGREPDPESVRHEAEAFVARYGPTAELEDMIS